MEFIFQFLNIHWISYFYENYNDVFGYKIMKYTLNLQENR